MTELILLRGIPGAGKSSLAKSKYIPLGYKHFEADMFFFRDGVYYFDPSRLSSAHRWCQNATYNALSLGQSVVVSNTFTTHKEIFDYIDMATTLNIPYRIIHVQGNFKSIHNVPDDKITIMKNRWQPILGEEIYIPIKNHYATNEG